MKKIFAIICENGLGHFRRAVGLLFELKKRMPECEIEVVCERWQIERTSDWDKTELFSLPGVTVHEGIVANGVRWDKNEEYYQPNILSAWEERLIALPGLMEADLVISDNLATVLKYRSDAIVMGSFLWSDVMLEQFPENPEVIRFAKEEISVMETAHPQMICVKGMVMPVVEKLAHPIIIPWFGQSPKFIKPSWNGGKLKIGLLTGVSDEGLGLTNWLLDHITDFENFHFVIPHQLYVKKAENPQLSPFYFQPEDFQSCDLVLARPGICTLTDCLTASTPLLMFYESGNKEMTHNARQVEKMGYGIDLGADPKVKKILNTINEICQTNQINELINHLNQATANGFEVAADWIIQKKLKQIYA